MQLHLRKGLWFVFLLCPLSLTLGACSSSDSNNGNNDAGASDATDGGAEVDAPADEPFGRACKLGSPCDKDPEDVPLICIGVEGSKEGMGFCTRTCNAQGGGPECYGVPNGQWSSCYLKAPDTDAGPGQSYCVYLCKSPQPEGTWSCPGTLRCGQENEDGVAFCMP